MIKILIIGSAGFIGSNTYKNWAQNNKYDVWGADVVACPTQAKFIKIDAENPDFAAIFAAQSFTVQNFDVCLNCSGAAQVGQSFEQPQKDYELNTRNVFAILEAIRQHCPACKFINLSSAAVYGNPPAIPVVETMPLRPLSPYGFHKKMAEDICLSFAQNFGLKTCALRIFSAFGEGLRKQLFWDITQKAGKNADKIELWGTGEESRDFIYIQDLIAVFDCILSGAAFNGEAINVGSGVEINIRHAAQTLLNAIDYKGEIQFSQQQKIGDPLRWLADISQLRALGFSPKYSLEKGLQNYAQWLRLEYKD